MCKYRKEPDTQPELRWFQREQAKLAKLYPCASARLERGQSPMCELLGATETTCPRALGDEEGYFRLVLPHFLQYNFLTIAHAMVQEYD